jgi:hypothetical protein
LYRALQGIVIVYELRKKLSSPRKLRVRDGAFWSAQALLAVSGKDLRLHEFPAFTPTSSIEMELALLGQTQVWVQTTNSRK